MNETPLQFLVVGNCAADNSALTAMLTQNFPSHIEYASTTDQARDQLARTNFDLVLVNRIFDANGEEGISFIAEQAKSDSSSPLMLISNYQESQEQAVSSGAVMGFGKSKICDSETIQLIKSAVEG